MLLVKPLSHICSWSSMLLRAVSFTGKLEGKHISWIISTLDQLSALILRFYRLNHYMGVRQLSPLNFYYYKSQLDPIGFADLLFVVVPKLTQRAMDGWMDG